MIEWYNVNSSAIRRIGYDSIMRTMFIDFEGSSIDRPYCGVPEELFRNFIKSDSMSRFYNQNIKNIYGDDVIS